MKAPLPNAFAPVRLGRVIGFHPSPPGTIGPDFAPIARAPDRRNRRPRPSPDASSHALPCEARAHLERSDSIMVTPPPARRANPAPFGPPGPPVAARPGGRARGGAAPAVDYELFNRNNFNIRHWSWNYRGCWHQTCPPIVPRGVGRAPPIPDAAAVGRRAGTPRHYLLVPRFG